MDESDQVKAQKLREKGNVFYKEGKLIDGQFNLNWTQFPSH